MDQKHRNPGRPPKPLNSAKSRTITIRLTPDEDERVRAGAGHARLTIRDFLVVYSLRQLASEESNPAGSGGV